MCIRDRKAVLTNIDLSHSVGDGNLDDDLSGHIVVVSSVSRDYHGFALVLSLRKCVENGLHEVLEIMLLGEHLNFLSQSTGSWLLVLVWLLNSDNLLGKFNLKLVLVNPSFGVVVPTADLLWGEPKVDLVVGGFDGVRSMDDISSHIDAEISSDGSWL